MTAIEQISKFAAKHGIGLVGVPKIKQKEADISNAAKQKDLVIKIAKDLGYVE